MNSSSGLGQGSFYGLVQMALDQEIRALGVDTDAGKIGPVSDAPQPGVEFHQIKIGTEKTGNNDHRGVITAGYAEAVIDRSCVQQENLSRKQRFCPR